MEAVGHVNVMDTETLVSTCATFGRGSVSVKRTLWGMTVLNANQATLVIPGKAVIVTMLRFFGNRELHVLGLNVWFKYALLKCDGEMCIPQTIRNCISNLLYDQKLHHSSHHKHAIC